MRFVEIQPGQVRLLTGAPAALVQGWARIKVTACGVCGTDLHLLEGMVMPTGAAYPVRPGHEVAGEVIETAQDVTAVSIGDSVVLHPLRPCGLCQSCTSGSEQQCADARVLGIHDPGGMADEVVWPAERMVKTGTLPSVQAALLADAVATAWHALTRAAVPRGGSLAVIGAGGVGTQVLQLAQATNPGVTLAAVVRSAASAARLDGLGLAAVLQEFSGCAKRLKSAVGPFDAVIDFSGMADAAGEGIRALHRGGVLVLGSVIDAPLDLRTTTTAITTSEISVVGSYSSSMADLRIVTEMAVSGAIDLSGSASHELPLSRAPHAFEVLKERPAGMVRVVVVP